MAKIIHDIDTVKLDISIKLLKQYVNDSSIEPLISALEAVKKDPDNESLLEALTDSFAALGIVQGAVLTYAPYLSFILSNDLFDDD